MKRALIISLLAAVAVIGCSSKDPSNPNFVVAEGKGIKITRGELTKERDAQIELVNVGKEPIPEEQLTALDMHILRPMIDKQLVLNAAKQVSGLDLEKEVNETFEHVKKQVPDEKTFKEQLKRANYTPEKLKNEMREQLALEKVMEANTKEEDLVVSDEEVKKFYDANPKLWDQPKLVRAQHILALVNEDMSDEEKAKKKKMVEDARKRVLKGEKFEDVAKEVSEDKVTKMKGGLLPVFGQESQVAKDFVDVVFKTKAGKLSPVFKTKYGYHVVKVLSFIPPKKISMDEAKDSIKMQLGRGKKIRAMQAVLKKLNDDAQVKIHLPQANQEQPAPETAQAPAPKAEEKK